MKRLADLTAAEKKFIDDALAEAEREAGQKINRPNRYIVGNHARTKIE
ncbi:hypothetical protein J2R62_18885 [Plesiomonas shigelloides]|uniref:Uncharacterized protein n=1 Tax=Plesiomonas shigelloides TaxID=703 RepID=A0A8I2B6Z2_PLESH|nr:hypothetical protein [Plesiomonas shigelloides]MBO1110173.1 hypothetical protein [Plesiomonas shigelloides]